MDLTTPGTSSPLASSSPLNVSVAEQDAKPISDSTVPAPEMPVPTPVGELSDSSSGEVVPAATGEAAGKIESAAQEHEQQEQVHEEVIIEDEIVLRELERERVQEVLDYMVHTCMHSHLSVSASLMRHYYCTKIVVRDEGTRRTDTQAPFSGLLRLP